MNEDVCAGCTIEGISEITVMESVIYSLLETSKYNHNHSTLQSGTHLGLQLTVQRPNDNSRHEMQQILIFEKLE